MPEFAFGEEIDRRATLALKHRRFVASADGMDLFPGGVADMDFRAAPCITQATGRTAQGVDARAEARP